MSDIFWRKVDPRANYQTVNARLNGLPDFLRKQQVSAPSPLALSSEKATEDPRWLKWISSFNKGFIEGVPFLKPVAEKLKLIPESQKKLMEQAAVEKPGANIIGSIAGGIGSTGAVPMIKPVTGGVGLAGKGLLQALGRGAANAASYSVPMAISQGVETGDAAGALKSGLIGLGTGAITGAAGEGLSKLATKGYKALRNWIDDTILKAGGVRGKKLMEVLQGGLYGKKGFTPQRAQELKGEIAEAIAKNKLYGKQDVLQFIDDKGKIWNQIDEAWKAAGAKVDDFRDQVIGHADVMDVLTSPLTDPDTGRSYAEYAKATMGDVFQKASSRKDLASVREYLWTTMKNGLKDGTNLGQIKADIAGALRDAIDNAFIPPGLKDEYPALLAMKKSFAWNEASVARSGASSSTAPRMLLANMIKGLALPGAGASAGITKWDPEDPRGSLARIAKYAGAGAAVTLGGNVLNQVLQKGGVNVMGRLAGAARSALPEQLPAVFSGLSKAAQVAGTKAAPPAAVAMSGQQDTAARAAEQSAEQQETAAPPEAVQEARNQVNQKYRDVLAAKMHDIYNSTFAQYAASGLTYEVFEALLSQALGGLDDPKKTAKILIDDKAERAQFLADYDAALKFQSMNLDPALGYYTPHGLIGMGSPSAEEKLASEDLVNYMSTVAGGGKDSTEAERKRIDARLKTIANMKVSAAQKRKLIEQTLAGYGLDFNRLSSLGLYGGANG